MTDDKSHIMQQIFTNSTTKEEVYTACMINEISVEELFQEAEANQWMPGSAVLEVIGSVDLDSIQEPDVVELQAKASVSEIKILHNYSVKKAQAEIGVQPAGVVIKMVGDLISNRTRLCELEAMVYKVDIGKSSNLSAYLKFKEEALGYEQALKEMMENDPDE